MKKVTSYLSTLRFDPNLYKTWYARYLIQIRLVLMLILAIAAVGLFAYFQLPRRVNPEIKIPIVIITTVLPGASPQDIESLITIPLEESLDNLEGVDSLVSSSQESLSTITIQFLSKVDADKARDDVQSAVDSAANLPEDAKDPQVLKLDFENQPIWNFAILTDKDEASLMRLSKNLQKEIERGELVDRVTISGLDTQEVEVTILPQKAQEFNISPALLAQLVKAAASSYPAGNVQTGSFSFALAIDKELINLDDIRNIRLNFNNSSVRLGEVAKISFISTPNQRESYYIDKNSKVSKNVQFFVFKGENANIDASEKQAKRIVENFLKEKRGFRLVTIVNSAEEIVTQFNDLTRDFFSTITLVFILLLVFLGLKQAIISAFTVPLTFLSTFAIMNILGLSLNFLTMFAFLIALGLLIDDTIVTVAATTRYFATGKFTSTQTGILVWRDFIVPLWSTTIATIWAFIPLLLSTGIIGEFIKSIPIVVTATMLSSTSIAVLITLPLLMIFLKPNFPPRVKLFLKLLGVVAGLAVIILLIPKNVLFAPIILVILIFFLVGFRVRKDLLSFLKYPINKRAFFKKTLLILRKTSSKGLIDIEVLSRKYMEVINRILISKHGKRNTLIIISLFALSAYLLIPFGLVKNEFFPKQDLNLLFLSVELPSGTNVKTANEEAVNLLTQVKDLENLEFAVAEAGVGFSAMEGRVSAANNILATLHLKDFKKRDQTSSDIAQKLRAKFANYTKGTLTVQEQSGGPPAGADLQISLLGDDLSALDSFANRVIQFLQSESGIANADESQKPGISKIVFTPDKGKLFENNLDIRTLSLYLRTYASGFNLDSLKFEETKDQDITLRFSENSPTPEDLGTINIPTQSGGVPLLSLGKLSLSTNPTIINRDKGKRSITVTASVLPGNNIQDKNKKLEDFVKNELNLPSGYSWKIGGVNEENQRSVNSILQAMVISFLLILITMVVEFRSFRQTFIALMIIPLSVAGVLYIFGLTHTPLSFPALIGILALFGIVVTHAIVVIEKINDNLKYGLPLKEAIVDAAGSRLEPVLLTSLATIAGLIPITLSDPLWRGLGGAIIAGLLFSGLVKLFFVPVTFYLFFAKSKWSG